MKNGITNFQIQAKSTARLRKYAFGSVLLLIFLSHLVYAAGPGAVNLGSAGNFIILAKSGISTTGATSIIGNIGVSPAAASTITGFSLALDPSNTFATSIYVTGNVYASDYLPPTPAALTSAVSAMQAAYTDAAGRALPNSTVNLGAGNIGGMTLAPGLYTWSTDVNIASNGLTISGASNDVWIFQISGNLNVANAANIVLTGGAQAKNIFWQVAGGTGATLGTTSDFSGVILSQTQVIVETGATLNGAAYAQTDVTLDSDTVSEPTGNVVSLGTPTITPTIATILDSEQSIAITATLPSNALGAGPYTYNFLIANSITGNILASHLYAGVAGTSNTFLFTSNTQFIGNTLRANVIVTDSESSPVTVNSIKSAIITVNLALGVPTITPAAVNSLEATVQSIAITASLPAGSTGTSTYTYNFLVTNTVTGALVANQLWIGVASTSNTFLFIPNSALASNILKANVIITDSATIPSTTNSVKSSNIIVFAQPTIALSSKTTGGASSNSLTYGNGVTFNAIVTGGSGAGNFLYSWTINGAPASNTVTANTFISSNILTLPGVNSYTFNVVAIDNGVTTPYDLPSIANVLVVSKNSSLSAIATGPTTSDFFTGATETFNGSATINNQSPWSLYVNGVLYGTTNSVISWSTFENAGTFNFVFSNGNSNYTSDSIGSSLSVSSGSSGGGVVNGGGGAGASTTTTVVTTTGSTIPTTTVSGSPAGSGGGTIDGPSPIIKIVNFTADSNMDLDFNTLGTIVSLGSESAGTATITVSNVSSMILAPVGLKTVTILDVNVSATANVTIALVTQYDCGIPSASIAPYERIPSNGTWMAITPFSINSTACTVSFSIPNDPVIALFEPSNTTSTIPTTTITTTTVPSSAPTTIGTYGTTTPIDPVLMGAIVVVIIILIAGVAYYFMKIKKPKRSR